MNRNELYLKTAFCCMACDGEIAQEEIETIENMPYFKEMDLRQLLSSCVEQLKQEGSIFLKKYLDEVRKASLSELEECELTKIAIQTIEVDEAVEYNEIAFFKKIRKCLKASDDTLLAAIPNNDILDGQICREDYLQPDIVEDDDMSLWADTFTNLNISFQ